MENIYENYSVEQLESELAQVRDIICDTGAQVIRKEAREAKLEKEIKARRREAMPTYVAEMSLSITLREVTAGNALDVLRKEILSNPNIDIESLIITKK